MVLPDLTKAQVKKAGRTARQYLRQEIGWGPEIEGAFEVIWRYRAVHQHALTKATIGLRSMVRTEGCQIEVAQRLKRLRTILDKLVHEPTMQLSTMQDIGGCRAVLATVGEVRRVERRLKKNRPLLGYRDYIGTPRSSGYRGVHVIVGYRDVSGTERAIEVQLRTRVMHEWAIAVERFSGRVKEDLKSGRGPAEVLALLKSVSDAMAIEESGGVVPEEHLDAIARLRQAAVPYLGTSPR